MHTECVSTCIYLKWYTPLFSLLLQPSIIIFIAVATYTCNSGFVLRGGDEMRTCVDAGDSEGFCRILQWRIQRRVHGVH